MSTLDERLAWARKQAGYAGPGEAAAALGVPRFTYTQHENGIRGFRHPSAVQYAKKFKVSLDWLLTGKGDPKGGKEAILVGKVGAGAEITRFDEGVALAGVQAPPGIDAPNVAEIDGESQYPLQPGWLIFYGAEHQGVPDACVGKLCVVQVKDGPTLLKTLKRGARKGLFRLESWNAPPREDQRIEWAALVTDIRPR